MSQLQVTSFQGHPPTSQGSNRSLKRRRNPDELVSDQRPSKRRKLSDTKGSSKDIQVVKKVVSISSERQCSITGETDARKLSQTPCCKTDISTRFLNRQRLCGQNCSFCRGDIKNISRQQALFLINNSSVKAKPYFYRYPPVALQDMLKSLRNQYSSKEKVNIFANNIFQRASFSQQEQLSEKDLSRKAMAIAARNYDNFQKSLADNTSQSFVPNLFGILRGQLSDDDIIIDIIIHETHCYIKKNLVGAFNPEFKDAITQAFTEVITQKLRAAMQHSQTQ